MDLASAENQPEQMSESEQATCVWKIVLTNNLNGVGTSFNPDGLPLSAFRCLHCNGVESQCTMYVNES